ncbi:hypothetical protein [Arthrobacter glacialis]|uniref:Uncharacterized protein n=1 Tax=Arthrobacter glacialis TaxID=1664 RepID=A0A2S3ZRW1_ARTGL|nr:hypothetical protein [Arthrobacter glacialis]POH71607.1 hypothetical protein CVS27_20040 [Arthrobacter glacialis]
MTVDWSGYPIFPTLFAKRVEARENFKHELAIKEERKLALAQLTAQNGIVLEDSYECYLMLNAWFRENACPEPGDDENLMVEWICFARDLNLFMCDALVDRYPWLEWTLYTTSKKSENYQRGVLKGFKNDPRKHVCFAPVFIGWGYVYLKKPKASATAFVRQFVYGEDIPIEPREDTLNHLLGSDWKSQL